MRIHIKVSGYYDWTPIPKDVEVTEKDIASNKVKPSADGSWLMRVPRQGDTHTDVQIPETEIIALLMQDAIKENVANTRADAAGHWLARHVMPHHAHRSWIKSIETQDDGPDEQLFEAEFQRFAGVNLLSVEDHGEMLDKYLQIDTPEELVGALSARLGVKKESV